MTGPSGLRLKRERREGKAETGKVISMTMAIPSPCLVMKKSSGA